MKIYPPNHLTFRESKERTARERQKPQTPVADEALVEYSIKFIETYRNTLEVFFPYIASQISTYSVYPLKTSVIRMGPNGIFIFYKQNDTNEVEILDFDKLDPPVDSNFFDIKKRFDPCWGEFDFSGRPFSLDEAEVRARSQALNDSLQVFWLLLDRTQFEDVCRKLIEAETGTSIVSENTEFDHEAFVVIEEPAGFRREEKWAFEIKHFKESRVSRDVIAQADSMLAKRVNDLDAICLVTSGDVTSIGTSLAIKNPGLRVWDRPVLNSLFNKHLDHLGDVFKGYKIAAEFVSDQIVKLQYSRYIEFEKLFNDCPSGPSTFRQYEEVCSDALQYIFEGKLKHIRDQKPTEDGTQIRDTTFRNLRTGDFFTRIFSRFDADFIVFDPKNYTDQITKNEFESISKYPNQAIGRFAVLVSPLGAQDVARKTQLRIFRNENKVILSLSNVDVLEMIVRRERGENPEDLLDDLLNELLLGA